MGGDKISRRDFFKKSTIGISAAAFTFSIPKYWTRAAQINSAKNNMQYRQLGRTGFMVSEIGFGSYPVKDPNVVHYAIDQGINYIDTAHDYTGGLSEETIGKAIKERRDDVILTTKWHPWAGTKADEMMEQLNTSLKRLQTDHVDCLLMHQIGKASGGESIERLKNPEWFKAMEMAKKQGKVRYFGCSGHDGDLMEVMNCAIEIPEISVILCRYNFLSYPTERELFKNAKAKGVGAVAMKTLSGARGEDISGFRDKHTSFKQGALKWVLSNPDISNLIISISNIKQVDEYVASSGQPMTGGEKEALLAYGNQFGNQVCRMCNECESSCDKNVPVSDVLRYRMYEKEYKMTGEGKQLYAKNVKNNYLNSCTGCAAPCLNECFYGVNIPGELKEAHKILRA